MTVLTLFPESMPPVSFHDGSSKPEAALYWQRLVSVSEVRAGLRIHGGETPTVRIVLDNGDGRISGEIGWKHLTCRAMLRRDGQIVFSGSVRSIEYGTEIVLELEA